jgi:hypothetical protein
VLFGLIGSGCGFGPPATADRPATPSPTVVYGFAGVDTSDNVEHVEALRATITWTVEPVIVRGYSVSTWIAFAVAAPGHGVSNQIAQIGWIETDPGEPHVFWEWGSSSNDSHRQIGDPVHRGVPLHVELDFAADGTVTFIANGTEVGRGDVAWTPTAIGAFAETHMDAEYLPGSSAEPEVIDTFEEKTGTRWTRYSGRVLTTSDKFHVIVAPDGAIRIWDERHTSP